MARRDLEQVAKILNVQELISSANRSVTVNVDGLSDFASGFFFSIWLF